MAVVAVETRRPRAVDELVFTDPLQAIGVGAGDCAIHQFIEHLRQTRGIVVINEELGRTAAHSFGDAVAVAIVGQQNAGACHAASSGFQNRRSS